MGYTTNTCTATPVHDRIKKIRTYQHGGDIVQGLAFKEPGGAWTSYNIPDSRLPRYRNNIITWTFDHEDEPVFAMYGHMTDDVTGITQLGWLQLDVACQDGSGDTTPGTHIPRDPSPRPAPTPVPGENQETVQRIVNEYESYMDWDLSAKLRVSPGDAYVGYPENEGDEIAVAVWEDNVENDGIVLKSKTVQGRENYDGFYLGAAAGLMAVFAYSAYISYHEREGKSRVDSTPFIFENSAFALV